MARLSSGCGVPEYCIGSISGATHPADNLPWGQPNTSANRNKERSAPDLSRVVSGDCRQQTKRGRLSIVQCRRSPHPIGALHQREPRLPGTRHAGTAAAAWFLGISGRVLQFGDGGVYHLGPEIIAGRIARIEKMRSTVAVTGSESRASAPGEYWTVPSTSSTVRLGGRGQAL
jgi:hypothetical protein